MTSYLNAITRIANASSADELKVIDVELAWEYNMGNLTTSELSRLCDLSMRRILELDECSVTTFDEWVVPPGKNLTPLNGETYYTIQVLFETPEEFNDWDDGAHAYSRDAAFDRAVLTVDDGDGGVLEVSMSAFVSEMTETKLKLIDDCVYIDPDFNVMLKGMRKLKKVYTEYMTKRSLALGEVYNPS